LTDIPICGKILAGRERLSPPFSLRPIRKGANNRHVEQRALSVPFLMVGHEIKGEKA